MAKIRVQDATKELSAGVNKLLENLGRTRKQTQELLSSLKKAEESILQKQRELQKQQEAEAEAARRAEEAPAMNAYSSDAQEIAAQTESAPQPAPAPKENAPEAAARAEEKPAPRAEAKPEPREEARPERRPEPRAEGPRPMQRDPRGPRPAAGAPAGAPAGQAGPRPAGPYGRPVNPGQAGPRPAGPYGRPVNPGQAGPRPAGPYGRPVTPGQGGSRPGAPMGARPAGPGGSRPVGGPGAPRPGQGGGFNRPAGTRPMGGRKSGPELTPTVEKERVSNYDPNKKNYVRQTDPERVVRNKRQQAKGNMRPGAYDDDEYRGSKKKKAAKQQARPEPVVIEKAYMTAETITVRDLSERIGKPAGEIIKKLFLLGIMATINEELDYDTATLVCTEFGVELEKKIEKTAEEALSEEDFEDAQEDLVVRNPVVTIMGHVDHGKTSLLDYIRKTRVTASEAGGITQHIGAYTVNVGERGITFLDTPGHEAFTAMRARGAMVTDIAVLVVAADDGVMPQTIESINHAKAADVPVIVAINKCDKPEANPDRIRQDLTEYNLVCEDWGGDTIMVEVSAVTGYNVDTLLEMILLQADVLDLTANPNRKARGAIVEAKLDKGRGPVATVLVQNGTLRVGDMIVAGTAYGRVRAMTNDRGERVKEAGPSMPVEVIGFNDVPSAGDTISAVDDDKLSRQVAEERKDKLRAALIKNQSRANLDDLFSQISTGEVKELNLVVKADVQGSVEAVKQSLEKLSNDEVRVRVIHGAVGAITESDIMLASASNAIIIGFNVRNDAAIREIADREHVDVRIYRVIYNAIEEVEAAMKGMLAPQYQENALGAAEVRQTFKVSGVGTIAGCYVTEGKIVRNAKARLVRDGVVIREAKIESLRRFKDDAKEVASGYECGIGLENFNDVKEGDVIECYEMQEIER